MADFLIIAQFTKNGLQILGCELHQNAFGGRAPPGPTVESMVLPRPLSRYYGGEDSWGAAGESGCMTGLRCRTSSKTLMIDFLIVCYVMNSMCFIGYCLNASILTIVLDYGAMTALCHSTQTDETLYAELPLKSCCTPLTYCIILLY